MEDVGGGWFRLLHSPAMVEGLARGDVFRLDSEAGAGFVVREHAGLAVVWVFFENEVAAFGRRKDLEQVLLSVNGVVEGLDGSLAICSAPIDSGVDTIADTLDRFVADLPGVTWMFGNLYDSVDGETPLNWWQPLVRA